MENRLDGFAGAYRESFDFYDENIALLEWYSSRIVERMKQRRLRSLISLGIGHKIVSRRALEGLGSQLEKYYIVEGSPEIIAEYAKEVGEFRNLHLFNSFFEEFHTDERFDAIEMGFVLEHVENPLSLIVQYSSLLNPGGVVFLAVPNARSLHRLIGNRAGIFPDLYQLSAADRELGHLRYFDRASFVTTIQSAGLSITCEEGIYLKPFSTGQLKSLALPPAVMHALFSIGKDYPDIANAIYVEATR